MEKAPRLSVVIPVYNVEKYLARCLESVLSQEVRDMEILCVDDGSTDGSLEILKDYAARDSRVRVVAQENRGVSAARNAGLDIAQGEWISFVDGDDELLPGAYASLLENCGDEDFICFGAEEVRENAGRWIPIRSGYFDVVFNGTKRLTDDELLRFSMTVWDKLYRRSAIEAQRLRFPEGLRFEDNVFMLNFAGFYRNCRFVPQKCYRYFRHEGSFMEDAKLGKERLAFDYISILDPIYEFWRKHSLLPQHQAAFERVCFKFLRGAVEMCQPWERTGIVYALATLLHRWDFKPERRELRDIKEGRITVRLGAFPGKDITMLKPLKGLEKIIFVGNWQKKRIFCLFGIKLFSWRKEHGHRA